MKISASTIILLLFEIIVSTAVGAFLIVWLKKKIGKTKTVFLGIGETFLFTLIISSVVTAVFIALNISFLKENTWQYALFASFVSSFFALMSYIAGYRFIKKRRTVSKNESLAFGIGVALCDCVILFLNSLSKMLSLSVLSMPTNSVTEEIKNTLNSIGFFTNLNETMIMLASSVLGISFAVIIFNLYDGKEKIKALAIVFFAEWIVSFTQEMFTTVSTAKILFEIATILAASVLVALYAKKVFKEKIELTDINENESLDVSE